jgi:hypothetical protein
LDVRSGFELRGKTDPRGPRYGYVHGRARDQPVASRAGGVSNFGGVPAKTMPCPEVALYLNKTLRMPRGSVLDIKTIPNVDVSQYDQTMAAMSAAGYQLSPGIHVGFLTEPKRDP